MGCKAIFLLGGLVAATLAQAATPAEHPAAASALLTIADGEVTLLRGRVVGVGAIRWIAFARDCEAAG